MNLKNKFYGKIDLLNEIIHEFAMTPQQIVENWYKVGVIDDKYLLNLSSKTETKAETLTLLPSKKFVKPKTVCPGIFCYSAEDNLIFPEIIPELKEHITSVLCNVIKTKIYSFCRKQQRLPWSNDYLCVEMPKTSFALEQHI